MSRVYKNKAIVTPSYDGKAKTGRGIKLLNQPLAIPIHHTLGSDTIVNGTFDTDIISWTQSGGGTISWDSGTQSLKNITTAQSDVYQVISTTIGNTYMITGNVTGITTTCLAIAQTSGWADIESLVLVDGDFTLFFTATTATSAITIRTAGGQTVYIDNMVTKQITNPNSYLSYYDITTKEIIQLGNSVDGGSSDNLELITDNIFSDVATNWTLQTLTTSKVGSELECTTTSAYGLIKQDIDTAKLIGKTIQVYARCRVGTTASLLIRARDNGGVTLASSSTSSSTTVIVSFECQPISATSRIEIVSNDVDAIETFYLTDVYTKEILPISTTYTLNDATINNILTHSEAFDANSMTALNSNPNLLAKLGVSTGIYSIDELNVALTASDAYYACSENEGAYVVDARDEYGSEIVTNGDFTITTGWTAQSSWNISGGNAVLDGLQASTNFLFQELTIPPVVGSYVVISLDVISYTSGFVGVTINGGTSIHNLGASVGTHSLVVQVESGSDTTLYIRGAVGDAFTIDNISVREATASEITNYASTVRTSAVDLVNASNSLQTCEMKLDGAGVPYAMADEFSAHLENSIIGEEISIGFKPNLDRYSILECVSGELQNFGGELVTNGAFDTGDLTGFRTIGTVSVVSNEANIASNSYLIVEPSILENGKTYRVSLKSSTLSGGIQCSLYSMSNYFGLGLTLLSGNIGNDGITYEVEFTSGTTNQYFAIKESQGVGGVLGIDNVSVKEILPKSQKEEFRFLTHEAEKLGSELVVNGTFDTDSVWSKGGGWTISGGFGVGTDAPYPNALRQINVAEVGRVYEISFDLVSISSGGISILLGVELLLNDTTIIGTHTIRTVATGTYLDIRSGNGGTPFNGTVDNVSVKEITEENNYRINHVLQDNIPLPNPSAYMGLNGIAKIGYPDTIKAEHGKLMVFTSVKTEAEQLIEINKAILATREVLTDEFDVPFEDENGMYQYL